MTEKVTKKEEAFKLFDEGKTTSSPEVKELKLKGATRYNYYAEWQKARGAASPSPEAISEAKVKGEVVSELEMVVPSEGKELGEGRAGEEMKGKIPRTVLTFVVLLKMRTENCSREPK